MCGLQGSPSIVIYPILLNLSYYDRSLQAGPPRVSSSLGGGFLVPRVALTSGRSDLFGHMRVVVWIRILISYVFDSVFLLSQFL